MSDVLFFNKKPKLRIGQIVKKIMTDNGCFVFHYLNQVKKIEKKNNHYYVTLEQKYENKS